MAPPTDDNPTVENSEFETKHDAIKSELGAKISCHENFEVITKKIAGEEETYQKYSEIRRKSPLSEQDSVRLMEIKMSVNAPNVKEDGYHQASNGLLPTKTDSCERKTVAPDGGWGWVVLGGCVYSTIMLTSIGMCFSIEFGQLMKSFKMSATAISWAFNMHTFTWNLTVPVTAPLCRSMGWRRVGICSSLIAALSYVALAFAFSPAYIFIFFSFLFSAAIGVTHNITLLILPAYFEKHRGLALGLNVTGVAVGQMVMPQVVRVLQAEFGFRGATLIHAGLLLNVVVATTLFRPLENNTSNVEKRTVNRPPPAPREIRLTQELNKRELMLGDSIQSLNILPTETKDTLSTIQRGKEIRQVFIDIGRNIRNSAAALKTVKILISCIGFSFFILGYLNFVMMIPFAMLAEGHSLESVTWCLSGAALSNFFSRLTMACLADRTWFSIKWTYMAGSVISGFFCFSFVFALPSVTWVMVCMVGWGVGLGFIVALWVVLLIETVGLDQYVVAMGASSLVMSVAYISGGPIFGVIRDASSTYSGSVTACAVLQFSNALLWLVMPCAQKADLRREVRREKEAHKDML